MSVCRKLCAGLSSLLLGGLATSADASLTAQWQQSVSGESGYVANDLQVTSSTDWIIGQVLIELDSGELLYFTPGVAPNAVSDVYDNNANPQSQTRPYGGSPLHAVNSDIASTGDTEDTASLLDNPPDPGDGSNVPATASLTKFDLTWYGPPEQTNDTGTMNLLDVTASNNANGTWAIGMFPDDPADDLEISGIVFRGMMLDSEPVTGDLNLDGSVDGDDFGIFAGNFGSSSSVWLTGDLNGDGATDGDDFGIFAANFGSGPSSVTASDITAVDDFAAVIQVPEPSTAGVLALGGLACMIRRRTKA